MKTEDAVAICRDWLAHIERQKERAKRLQEIASMARNGQEAEARRLRQQMDLQPNVFDGAKLQPAVEQLIKVVEASE